jgi:D-glycero-alpha-D-manno-heptose 1-phosphate guanylyltransferase
MPGRAIILAGGFGTRLQDVVCNIPKPMANIGGQPFLEYLLGYLSKNGVRKVVFSVGYKYKVIQDYFGSGHKNVLLSYSIEEKPLGTGGAIKKALNLIDAENVFVLNGDTFFNISLPQFFDFYKTSGSDLAIALKPMKNCDRYGTVETKDGRVVRFVEKQADASGNINGGIYLMRKTIFDNLDLPEKFSFEKDFLEKYVGDIRIFGRTFDSFFIDIGTPQDYEISQTELRKYL